LVSNFEIFTLRAVLISFVDAWRSRRNPVLFSGRDFADAADYLKNQVYQRSSASMRETV
jgi:hypothetical protein